MSLGRKDGCHVNVYVRSRPLPSHDAVGVSSLLFPDSNKVIVQETKQDTIYSFDHVFPSNSKNSEVCDIVCDPLISNLFSGNNGSFIVYGQTGAGKTHTVLYPDGIIPTTIERIFEVISRCEKLVYKVFLSYLQIYQERIYDLLAEPQSRALTLREHPKEGIIIEGLWDEEVNTSAGAKKLIEIGQNKLIVTKTATSPFSSKSHAVCIFKVCKYIRLPPPHLNSTTEEMAAEIGTSPVECETGKLHICDLAGTERSTKVSGSKRHLRESKHINTSLLELGNVIHALASKSNPYIPFRNSVLTRILKESLGGNSKASLMVCISSSMDDVKETKRSLNFGQRAMKVMKETLINPEPQIDSQWIGNSFRKKKLRRTDYKVLAKYLTSKLKELEIAYRMEKESLAALKRCTEQKGYSVNESSPNISNMSTPVTLRRSLEILAEESCDSGEDSSSLLADDERSTNISETYFHESTIEDSNMDVIKRSSTEIVNLLKYLNLDDDMSESVLKLIEMSSEADDKNADVNTTSKIQNNKLRSIETQTINTNDAFLHNMKQSSTCTETHCHDAHQNSNSMRSYTEQPVRGIEKKVTENDSVSVHKEMQTDIILQPEKLLTGPNDPTGSTCNPVTYGNAAIQCDVLNIHQVAPSLISENKTDPAESVKLIEVDQSHLGDNVNLNNSTLVEQGVEQKHDTKNDNKDDIIAIMPIENVNCSNPVIVDINSDEQLSSDVTDNFASSMLHETNEERAISIKMVNQCQEESTDSGEGTRIVSSVHNDTENYIFLEEKCDKQLNEDVAAKHVLVKYPHKNITNASKQTILDMQSSGKVIRVQSMLADDTVSRVHDMQVDNTVSRIPEMQGDVAVIRVREMPADTSASRENDIKGDDTDSREIDMQADNMGSRLQDMQNNGAVTRMEDMQADDMISRVQGILADDMVGREQYMLAEDTVSRVPDMIADDTVSKERDVQTCDVVSREQGMQHVDTVNRENYIQVDDTADDMEAGNMVSSMQDMQLSNIDSRVQDLLDDDTVSREHGIQAGDTNSCMQDIRTDDRETKAQENSSDQYEKNLRKDKREISFQTEEAPISDKREMLSTKSPDELERFMNRFCYSDSIDLECKEAKCVKSPDDYDELYHGYMVYINDTDSYSDYSEMSEDSSVFSDLRSSSKSDHDCDTTFQAKRFMEGVKNKYETLLNEFDLVMSERSRLQDEMLRRKSFNLISNFKSELDKELLKLDDSSLLLTSPDHHNSYDDFTRQNSDSMYEHSADENQSEQGILNPVKETFMTYSNKIKSFREKRKSSNSASLKRPDLSSSSESASFDPNNNDQSDKDFVIIETSDLLFIGNGNEMHNKKAYESNKCLAHSSELLKQKRTLSLPSDSKNKNTAYDASEHAKLKRELMLTKLEKNRLEAVLSSVLLSSDADVPKEAHLQNLTMSRSALSSSTSCGQLSNIARTPSPFQSATCPSRRYNFKERLFASPDSVASSVTSRSKERSETRSSQTDNVDSWLNQKTSEMFAPRPSLDGSTISPVSSSYEITSVSDLDTPLSRRRTIPFGRNMSMEDISLDNDLDDIDIDNLLLRLQKKDKFPLSCGIPFLKKRSLRKKLKKARKLSDSPI